MHGPTRRPRTALAASAVALTFVAASGCGSGSADGGGDSQTLTYWTSQQGATAAATLDTLKPVLAKFTEKTGIKVKVENIDWAHLQDKILTAVASGQGPDLVNIGNTWAPQMQKTGAFLDFDAATLKKIGGKDKFLASSFATTGQEGKTPSSVPLYALAYGMFYNKKMFAEAGIDGPPATWAELIADGKKLTHDDQWGLAVSNSMTENAHFAFLLGAQRGAKLFDSSGKPDFTSAAEVAAVKSYVNLMGKEGIVNPSDAQNGNDASAALNAFANGKAAMVINQNNGVQNLKAAGMKDYGTAELPLLEGGENVRTFPAGINLAVFKNTDNLDGALKLVQYLTDDAAQQTLNEKFTSLPVTSSAYQDAPAVSRAELKPFQHALKTAAKPLPKIPQEGDFETQVGTAMQTLFAKAAQHGAVSTDDVRAALASAESKMPTK
jgi:multiple sugar transport system substrate-binding protein